MDHLTAVRERVPTTWITWAAWAAANAIIGVCAAIPLTTALVFSHYVRAMASGTTPAPYHGLEARLSLFVLLFGGGVVVAAVVLVNRVARRRLGLTGPRAVLFWVATLAVVLTPFYFYARTGI
ncbi:hypothetical protein [Actinokineospora sp. NBRC 105648]|uniref:hypothetical protein n=1 Tax=Actinokineospora sp. NBRC 105648 TaxID=3032206 RepID=UPI0024A1A955|nr:hypothetical protein [Actinokineospora sp. NBRC 105648]GLZ37040.1 hypothetical protein Acsp05_06650 [Actinokineospora sp. NBRC 105648]